MNQTPFPVDTEGWCHVDTERILELLSHRPPFLFVEAARVKLVPEPIEAIGVYTVSRDICQGHFPDLPVWPGVLWQEMLNQLAGLTIGVASGQPVRGVYYRTVKADTLSPAEPGDTLSLRAKIVTRGRFVLRFSGQGEVIKPSGELRAAFVSAEQVCMNINPAKLVGKPAQ